MQIHREHGEENPKTAIPSATVRKPNRAVTLGDTMAPSPVPIANGMVITVVCRASIAFFCAVRSDDEQHDGEEGEDPAINGAPRVK